MGLPPQLVGGLVDKLQSSPELAQVAVGVLGAFKSGLEPNDPINQLIDSIVGDNSYDLTPLINASIGQDGRFDLNKYQQLTKQTMDYGNARSRMDENARANTPSAMAYTSAIGLMASRGLPTDNSATIQTLANQAMHLSRLGMAPNAGDAFRILDAYGVDKILSDRGAETFTKQMDDLANKAKSVGLTPMQVGLTAVEQSAQYGIPIEMATRLTLQTKALAKRTGMTEAQERSYNNSLSAAFKDSISGTSDVDVGIAIALQDAKLAPKAQQALASGDPSQIQAVARAGSNLAATLSPEARQTAVARLQASQPELMAQLEQANTAVYLQQAGANPAALSNPLVAEAAANVLQGKPGASAELGKLLGITDPRRLAQIVNSRVPALIAANADASKARLGSQAAEAGIIGTPVQRGNPPLNNIGKAIINNQANTAKARAAVVGQGFDSNLDKQFVEEGYSPALHQDSMPSGKAPRGDVSYSKGDVTYSGTALPDGNRSLAMSVVNGGKAVGHTGASKYAPRTYADDTEMHNEAAKRMAAAQARVRGFTANGGTRTNSDGSVEMTKTYSPSNVDSSMSTMEQPRVVTKPPLVNMSNPLSKIEEPSPFVPSWMGGRFNR
jgi:hypothetical protein